ncbi:MAG: NAD(P)/FAD-dependent oxidoreductase [Propionibacteriaceae bacterium]|jgi:glycerol-3-phosphate dehydrogenase|nr:NAD(P)/FAD-dependent oxidoreductase [Propionibacteriaceae bacterium]
MRYDVVVIGAGLIGSAIARELAGCHLSVGLVDGRSDVGDGTSKANTAILHTGYDASPGTLESRLVAEGYHRLGEYAAQTGIPVERTGALLVAWTDEEQAALPGLADKARANGYQATAIVDAAAVYEAAPHLGPGARGGLSVPGESIICTWSTTIALATDAVQRGATLHLDTQVQGLTRTGEGWTLDTTAGPLRTRWLINAAGLGGDTLDAQAGYDRFHLHPRRGELLVFDKLAREKVPLIVLPVPSKLGKGVLVSPTIYGNVMVGPTAEDMTDRADTATTEAGFDFLLGKGAALVPDLMAEEVTAAYAGLRAAHDQTDYLIEADADRTYLLAGCIRSTGLTSCLAVAAHVSDLLAGAGLDVTPRDDLPDPPRLPNLGEAGRRPYQDDALIRRDPAYGEVVCFCERVTRGEIRDACQSTVPARTLGGLRRRTRATNGRCQGFFCGAAVETLLANERSQA